jgi:4-amino-4-deoxy-L-arabinose transferase-like glycosyltransferase
VPSIRVASGGLTPSRRTADSTLAAIVTVLWAATLVPLFDFGVADKRLLEAFSIDELIQLNLLHNAASAHSFALHFGPYGHFVFNLMLIVVRLLPGAVTDARILLAGRAINLLFGAGTAILTFAWSRRVYGTPAAWIAFSLVLVNATLYMGIAQVQPDIVQLFFLMAALAFTARLVDQPERRWLLLASAAAGLAFACKYSGLFVLPIIAIGVARRPVAIGRPAANIAVLRASLLLCGALAVALSFVFDPAWIAAHLTEDGRIDLPLAASALSLLRMTTRGGGGLAMLLSVVPWSWGRLRRWPHGLAVMWSWYLTLVTFGAAFVVSSPYSLRKAAFIKGILGEAMFAVPASAETQVAALRGMGLVVGWPAAVVALLTVAVLSWRARSPFRMATVDGVLVAWSVIYVIVLLLPAHEIYLDYALPLVPPVAMLAGRGAGALFQRWSDRALSLRMPAAAALAVIVLLAEAPLVARLLEERGRQRRRTTDSVQAYVATWLQCRAPASTSIAYDYFVYVPSTFPHAFVTWGGTVDWLASINPDLVVVEVATAGYAGEQPEHRLYYECLAAGTCGYERALSRENLVVYVRRGRRSDVLKETPAQLSARGCS